MLKLIIVILAFIIMLSNQLLNAQQIMSEEVKVPMLVLDEDIGLSLPRHFRKSTDEYSPVEGPVPSREGLDTLKAAASAQFSKYSLEQALKKIDGPVWIVDLRNESHGFVNGIPISWYSPGNQSNIDESDDNIQRQEEMLFKDISRQGAILANKIIEKRHGNIVKTKPLDLKVTKANTENSLISGLNLNYLRIGVLDHHKPNDPEVDFFVNFIKTLLPDQWLYMHCRGGKGRSTTFMVMYDIMRNIDKVSLDDIVKRQALLGGSDLFNISETEDDAWKKEAAIERKKFINKFYQYVKHSKGLYQTSWSQWIVKHQ